MYINSFNSYLGFRHINNYVAPPGGAATPSITTIAGLKPFFLASAILLGLLSNFLRCSFKADPSGIELVELDFLRNGMEGKVEYFLDGGPG